MTRRKCVYQLRREGTFQANLDPQNQCGTVGQSLFHFVCMVECQKLDEQGFVCDQLKVADLMSKWAEGVWTASCEALAGGGIIEVYKLVGSRALLIQMTVTPQDKAGVTLRWEKGMPLPDAYPRYVGCRPKWRD
jgi:hypothetical protein